MQQLNLWKVFFWWNQSNRCFFRQCQRTLKVNQDFLTSLNTQLQRRRPFGASVLGHQCKRKRWSSTSKWSEVQNVFSICLKWTYMCFSCKHHKWKTETLYMQVPITPHPPAPLLLLKSSYYMRGQLKHVCTYFRCMYCTYISMHVHTFYVNLHHCLPATGRNSFCTQQRWWQPLRRHPSYLHWELEGLWWCSEYTTHTWKNCSWHQGWWKVSRQDLHNT